MHIGKKVIDKESESRDPAIVVDVLDVPISEYFVDDIGGTVLDQNPGYPSSDTVVEVVFNNDFEYNIKDFVEKIDNGNFSKCEFDVYSYPSKRLVEYRQAKIWFDGACEPYNPGGHGTYGFVIKTCESEITGRGYIGNGEGMTNNIAEYTALVKALQEAKKYNELGLLEIYGDSKLVIKQMTGEYRVRNNHLISLYKKAKDISSIFDKSHFNWVPREKNQQADSLTKKEYKEKVYGDNKERAKNEKMRIHKIEGSKFMVKNYIVDIDKQSCTCIDHNMRNKKCKHIFKAEMEYEEKYNIKR